MKRYLSFAKMYKGAINIHTDASLLSKTININCSSHIGSRCPLALLVAVVQIIKVSPVW